jgi:RNA polymerase sigma-70 factor (ECF subfamily)
MTAPLRAESDEQLVARLREGDAAALRSLMERYQAPLYGYLRRMLSSADDAEDLFQETFLRVLKHAARFQTDRRFRPWIYAIATNLVRNTYRSRSYRQALTLDAGEESESGPSLASQLVGREALPSAAAEAAETADRVRRAVSDLPEKGRVALVLYYYQGLSYDEIATALEVPLGTVKSRIHNAMARLGDTIRRAAPDVGEGEA